MKDCKSKRTPSKQDRVRGKFVRVKAPDSAEKVFCSDFSFQELFVKNDLIGINERDIHFFKDTLAENGVETCNGRDIVEKFAIVAVEMRKDEIDVILSQGIEGSFSGEDSPQIGVIVLDISFLPGSVWFAVKDPCPAFFGHGTELNGHGVGKLGTIVRQDHGK